MSSLLYVAISGLVIIPCLWLPRIEAGDLGSHLYNAWLVQIVAARRPPGLALVHPTTNILFDFLLSWTLPVLGPTAAPKLVVPAFVLLFFWSAFAFVSAVSDRKPWRNTPILLVLAYGWVFQAGLLNFYAAAALAFSAAALWINRTARIAAPFLLLIAWLGNPLPVAWAIGVTAYRAVFLTRDASQRLPVLAGCAFGIAVIGILVHVGFPSQWNPSQILWATGADQLWIYGKVYLTFSAALLCYWAFRATRATPRPILPLHLAALTAVACIAIPESVLFPGYHHALTYIPQRLSLFTAMGICAAVNSSLTCKSATMPALLAVAYFSFLFNDGWNLNQTEEALDAAVARLVPESRVAAAFDADGRRINPFTHMLDRACIGHCFNYGNYEPSTWQFRLRAIAPNSFAVNDYSASFLIQNGAYFLSPADPDLFEITPCIAKSHTFCTVPRKKYQYISIVVVPF